MEGYQLGQIISFSFIHTERNFTTSFTDFNTTKRLIDNQCRQDNYQSLSDCQKLNANSQYTNCWHPCLLGCFSGVAEC